jgi:hypothetical protein
MILASLGGAMLELGQPYEAIELCRAAIAENLDLPNSFFNLSHAHKSLNQLDEAVLNAREAISRAPEAAEYHFHLAHTLLLQGEMEQGWAEYEWRWKLPDFAGLSALRANFVQPQWAGESLKGKTLLVYTEQGLGDIIQFARFLPLAAKRAGKLILAVQPATHRLLKCLPGIELVLLHDPLPAFDLHCPLLSLPRALAIRMGNIPAQTPYLHAEPHTKTRWTKRLGAKRLSGQNQNLRVGIVWAGNPAVQRDRFRSPGLEAMQGLFQTQKMDFVALQMGPGRADLTAHPLPGNVLDLGAEIEDLSDTAAIMMELDLVISSCTGPLHLAGALGVPCWAILPFAPHFPWLLDRNDSVWYPTMKLYRQTRPGRDWGGTIQRIAADLDQLAAAKRSRS